MLTLLVALVLAAPSPELLPDLVQRPPTGVRLRDGRLAFFSRVDNVGLGPVEIVARRATRMRADQLIRLSGSGIRVREGVGRLRYVRSRGHAHWHLLGFERYELWRSDRLLVRDRKTGFCLYDRVVVGKQRVQPHFLRDCGRGKPDAEEVHAGISPGFGDAYDPWLEGQSLDVRGLAPGVYTLVHRVNADRRLRELRYDNDVARVRIRLTRTSVTVLS